MDLLRLDQIELDQTSRDVLGNLADRTRQVRALRPLSPGVLARVRRELLGARVHSSNAIEGNTYTLRETLELLKTGHIDLGRRREAVEIRDLAAAIAVLQEELAPLDRPHTLEHLLRIHAVLLAGADEHGPGRLRDVDVMIAGAKYQPPGHEKVRDLLTDALRRLSDAPDTDPVVRAAWIHWAIARIHPCRDGNGRLARLWQDLVLFRSDLTCAIIRPEDRDTYYGALAAADDGNFNPLLQLVGGRVADTLDAYASAGREAVGLAREQCPPVPLPITAWFDTPELDPRLTWLHPPATWSIDASRSVLVAEARAGIDFWRKPHCAIEADDGHFLFAPVAGDFVMTTRVRFIPVHQYDQAGLMVRVSPTCWLKTSVEYEPTGPSVLGAVVTHAGYSDWSTQSFPAGRDEVDLRIRREGADCFVDYAAADAAWRQIRAARLTDARDDATIDAGLYLCSPKGGGFVAEFDFLRIDARPAE